VAILLRERGESWGEIGSILGIDPQRIRAVVLAVKPKLIASDESNPVKPKQPNAKRPAKRWEPDCPVRPRKSTVYIPSPETIFRACQEIQAGWSDLRERTLNLRIGPARGKWPLPLHARFLDVSGRPRVDAED